MAVEISYPLAPDPSPSPAPSSGAAAPLVTTPALGRKRGVLRPFRRDARIDFASATGDALLESKVGQVLGSDGEMPWRPEFRSNIDRLRHMKNSIALGEFARVYVGDALAKHLPSVRLLDVVAMRDERRVTLRVTFTRAEDAASEPITTTVILPEA